MTGTEIAAIAGAVVWVIERIFSWTNKAKTTKRLKRALPPEPPKV